MKFRLHIFNTTVCFLFLLTLSFGQGQAVITIASSAVTVYTNTVVVARDAIFVQPKTTFSVTAGNESRLYIDKTIQLPAAYDPGGVHTSNFTVPDIDYNLPVGTIAGSGNVTPSGQGVYNIPIALPPGTNGMAPSLGISYNSGSSDGLLGRGWNINGLSVITRVPKDVYHDNVRAGVQLNSSDVYALDGNRIIGNRLENDNFSKITLPNGTDPFFKVETKDGLTMEYGNVAVSSHSQLVLHIPTDVTFAWYLSKVYDKHGNYMLYDYYNQNGEVAIKEIKYTGNSAAAFSPYNFIKFYYDIRTDKREQYLLGNRMQRTLILREMQIDCEGNFVKGYKFAYGYDDFYIQTFLNSITEQGSDFSKLNTTYIQYGEGVAPVASTSGIVLTTAGSLPSFAEYRSGDFNGDGKSDLLAFEYDDIDGQNGMKTYTTCKVFINRGLTGANNSSTQFQQTQSFSITNKIPYRFSDFMSDYAVAPFGLQSADFNGDGKEDMILAEHVGSGGFDYTVYYANFSGTGFDINNPRLPFFVLDEHNFTLADINGDAKYEAVVLSGQNITVEWLDSPPPPFPSFGIISSDYSGLASIDYDGDGRHDLVSTKNVSGDLLMAVLKITAIPGGNVSTSELYIDGTEPVAYTQNFFGDFNGDGITDNVKVRPDLFTPTTFQSGRIRFGTGKPGTGNGYVKSNGTPADNFGDMEEIQNTKGFYSERKYLNADINNDGKSDLVNLEYSTTSSAAIVISAMLGGTTDNIPLETVLGCAPPAFDYSHLVPGNSSIICPSSTNCDLNVPCTGWPLTPQDCPGDPYEPWFPANTNYAYLIPEFVTGDFNGDGKQDIFHKTCTYPGSYALIYFDKGNQSGQPTQFSTGQFATVISDGFRNTTKFKYETLANSPSNAYIKGNNPQYPVIDFQQPLYIATQLSVPNGIGGFNTTTYKYEKAHLHLQGKGFLGFDKMTSDNLTAKIKTEDEYTFNNTFYEKTPSKTTVRTTNSVAPPANTLVSEDVYTNFFHVTVNNPNTSGDAHFITTDTIVSSNHISGAKTTQSLAYDGNGNITSSTTIIGNTINAATIETTLVATPNYIQAGSWLPNVPDITTTTITRTEDIANPYPRVVDNDYNIATGDITKTIIDPGKTKRIQTDYSVYDANTGVLKEVTVSDPGAAPTAKTINYSYDSRSRFITQTTNPLGQSSFATYDPKWGKPLTETGIDGLITKYKYDGYGRNISVTTPDNLTATTAYGWVQPGSLNTADYTATTFGSDIVSNALFSITSQRPGSPAARTIYDIYSRELASDIDGFNNKIFSANKYDARGTIFKQCGAYENIANAIAPVITTNLYDDLNRIISSQNTSVNTTPTIPPTAFSYTFPAPKNGNTIVTTTIPASASTGAKIFKKTTDASGLLRTSEDILGAATKLTYAYYSNRQLKTTTLGASDITNTLVYDEYGMQSSLSEANSGLTTYEFDAYGRLTKQTDANNNVTDLQYDLLDRVTQKIVTPPLPGGPDIYNYAYVSTGNGLNLLQSVAVNRQPANSTISSVFTYDNLNRIKKVDENINGPVFSTSFEYDQFSNITKETYPSTFAVFHDYTTNGYHLQIKRADNNQVIYHTDEMNALGQYTKYTLKIGSGLQTVKEYSDFGFPQSFIATGVQDLHFDFDPQNGNLISRADGLLSETFSYDDSDRLLTATGGSGVAVNYSPNGNIQDKTDATTGTNSYVYDPVKINALTKINNPTINISQSTQNVTYNPFHKAQTITEDLDQLDFTYGPDDDRKKTILKNNSILQSTRYFSGNYEETTDAITPANSNKIHYINCAAGLAAIYVIPPSGGGGALYFPYTDYLGSILTVTDDQGVIQAEQSFDAWGRKRNPSDWLQPLLPAPVPVWLYRGYTGHEQLDQFRLINMNGRMYDPLVGRMLSPDNNLQAPDYSQNHNRYSYALNNPLKFTDPSGNIIDDYNFDSDMFAEGPRDVIKKIKEGIRRIFGRTGREGIKLVKVKTEEREVTIKESVVLKDISRKESEYKQGSTPSTEPEVIPVDVTRQQNFAQWSNVNAVGFRFNFIGQDDRLSITRPKIIFKGQRNIFGDQLEKSQTPFFKSNRFLTPIQKDIFTIRLQRNLIFEPDYTELETEGGLPNIHTFTSFSAQAYSRSYKISLKIRGTAKYFEALKKSGFIE